MVTKSFGKNPIFKEILFEYVKKFKKCGIGCGP
jgi:hypothetical protein